MRWAVRKLGVEERLVLAVLSVYTGAKTAVRAVYGNSNGFAVNIGMQQGSALSKCLKQSAWGFISFYIFQCCSNFINPG